MGLPSAASGVFLIQRSLSLFLHPILALGDAVCAAVQKIDLIKTGFVAQLHDLGFEIFHRRVGAAVLASGFRVGGSVHVGQQRHIFDPQTVDDDMHMDVAGLVMPVRVGADDSLMTGKLLPAKPLTKLLRLVHGQPIVRAVPWVKADDVMVALDILALLILAITKRFKRALLPAIPAYLENFPFTTYNTTQSKMDGDF